MAAAPLVQFDFWPGMPARIPLIETPAARATDPDTSHKASAEITASGTRGEQQARALAAVRAFPHRTSQEIAEKAKLDRYELARRLPELRSVGLVTNPRRKTCSVTGKTALTWAPKLEGVPEK